MEHTRAFEIGNLLLSYQRCSNDRSKRKTHIELHAHNWTQYIVASSRRCRISLDPTSFSRRPESNKKLDTAIDARKTHTWRGGYTWALRRHLSRCTPCRHCGGHLGRCPCGAVKMLNVAPREEMPTGTIEIINVKHSTQSQVNRTGDMLLGWSTFFHGVVVTQL